jgi:hypothetical protein
MKHGLYSPIPKKFYGFSEVQLNGQFSNQVLERYLVSEPTLKLQIPELVQHSSQKTCNST